MTRPGGHVRTGAPTPPRTAPTPHRHPRHLAGMAPPPDRTEMDLPQPTWTPTDRCRASRPGHPVSAGKPAMGAPTHPRRTYPTRAPHRHGHHPQNPCRCSSQPCTTTARHQLAHLPAHPSDRTIGRLLPPRHHQPTQTLRPVRHGHFAPDASTSSASPHIPPQRGPHRPPATS
jgi:hypothetical protein